MLAALQRLSMASYQRLLAAALIMLCLPVFAAGIEMRAPYVAPVNGVYLLNAELMFTIPAAIERAVRDGATLNMELHIRVSRSRSWWRDLELADLQQRYSLIYHSVSERFIVRNLNSGAQESYATLEQAVVSLRRIENLPVVDQALVMPDARNEVSLRALVQVRSLPRALGLLLFWVDNFSLESDWYTWPMKS